MAPIFLGTHDVKLDSKGRVSIPAPFRPLLSRQGFDGAVLFPSYKVDGAIEGCGMDFVNQLVDSVNSYELFSDAQEDFSATLFAGSHQLAWDANGRVVLPEILIRTAGLTDKAVFVGNGKMFRIFEPKRYAAWQAERVKALKENPRPLPLGKPAAETPGGVT